MSDIFRIMAFIKVFMLIALFFTQTVGDYYAVQKVQQSEYSAEEESCVISEGGRYLASIHTHSENKKATKKCHDQVQ